jgi:hypothetical protein
MTRKKLAMLFASTLVLLYSYDVVTTVTNRADMKVLTLLGLGFALGLLVIEIRTVENDTAP